MNATRTRNDELMKLPEQLVATIPRSAGVPVSQQPAVQKMRLLGSSRGRSAAVAVLAASAALGVARRVSAQDESSAPSATAPAAAPAPLDATPDRFDLVTRSRTTVGAFQRALLPGPGGAIVTTDTLAPIHEALSVTAVGVDSFGQDDLDVQVAAYGQLWAGTPDDRPIATWDVSSAFLTQRFGDLALSLGRQPVAGGAARYRRLDGAVVRGSTPFGLTASAYGGLTVLPRWDQWYGYHHLGDAYEAWSSAPESIVVPARDENWMGGASLGFADERVGMVGVSYHHQAENQALNDESLGISMRLGNWSPIGLVADAIYSVVQRDWSDVRVQADWGLAKSARRNIGVGLRGEFLHTLPAALLSQASIFSVFSFAEVTEAGGEVEVDLPRGVTVALGGSAQVYDEGSPGARLRASAQLLTGEHQQTLLRLVASRVALEDNGYTQVRLAGRFPLGPRFTAYADVYQYFYDEPIRDHDSSTFATAHLGYAAAQTWNARVGGSVSQSPDAALDAQVLAQITVEWDREER